MAKLRYRPSSGCVDCGYSYRRIPFDEVAVYLKAGKRTVYRLAASGEIPAFKLGGTWRFRRSELDQWIAASISNKKKPDDR
ncbi:MAG: helix-turn-helix domain-containing protein [Acidiferrobacteraceae bacterium]